MEKFHKLNILIKIVHKMFYCASYCLFESGVLALPALRVNGLNLRAPSLLLLHNYPEHMDQNSGKITPLLLR